jgi:hypothetical protein
MRECAVSHVVEQCCYSDGSLVIGRDLVFGFKFCEYSCREVERTETVGESGVLGCLVSEVRESKLPDPPQTLKLSRVNKPSDERAFRRIRFETDYVMD